MTDIGRLKELSLFDAIQHGDDEHRAWLKAAITAHFAGEPVPPPSGSGRKDAEIETLRAENERMRKEREPLQRQVNETFCMFLDRGNELVFLHERLAAAERVVEAVRRYDTAIRTSKTARPGEYIEALAAFDQGKVTICDSAIAPTTEKKSP